MKTLLLIILSITLAAGNAAGQGTEHTFRSLDEVIAYSETASLDLIIDNIRFAQAKTAKKAAGFEMFDPTVSLPGTFTHFSELPVTLLPAEIFGGQPGSTVELRAGSPYTTEFSQTLEVKLLNPLGWADYKLAKINEDLTRSSGERTRQILQENLADSYYAIVNLDRQRASTDALLASADSVLEITQRKFEEGQVSQQDLNNAQVSKLNTKKSLRQIDYLLIDAYLTLKALCNIPETEEVRVVHEEQAEALHAQPTVAQSRLDLKLQLLNQDYARQNYKKSKSLLWPSLSFFAGNTYQLNNQSFTPLTGDWVNSNYLGLTLSFRLPTTGTVSSMRQAKLDYEIASREVEKAELALSIEEQRLDNTYKEAQDEYTTSVEIQRLQEDSYSKNLNLYVQGLLPVDRLLDSYDAMLNAIYAANASAISLELAYEKILINNRF
ncbi:MAG: TolC family protein [Bacteroidota bacterium]